MRYYIFSLVFIVLISSTLSAQEKPEFDPDYAWNTIRAEYGALVPVGPYPTKSFGLASLSYTRRYSGRWGWRTGMQYTNFGAPVDQYVGLPLSVVYRFRTKSFDGRVEKARDDIMKDLSWDYGGDPPDYEKERMRRSAVTDVLNIFLRRAELFAGVTPGYLPGLEPEHRFSLTANVGMTLSIPIGRFSLDFTPATYYLFTKNHGEYRWLYSISGGVSFLF